MCLAATTNDINGILNYSFQDLCHIGEVVARESVVRDKVPGGRYLQTLLLSDINRYMYMYEIKTLNMSPHSQASPSFLTLAVTEQLGGTLQMRLLNLSV